MTVDVLVTWMTGLHRDARARTALKPKKNRGAQTPSETHRRIRSVLIPLISKCYQGRRPCQKGESHRQSYTEIAVSNRIPLRWKTITVSTDGGDFHVVAYAALADILARRLNTIADTAEIATIYLDPSHFLLSRFRYPPRVTVDERGLTRIMQAFLAFSTFPPH